MSDAPFRIFIRRATTILEEISYPDREINLVPVYDFDLEPWYCHIQIHAKGTCNVTGQPLDWKSRKWLLSPHMTDGEIVQTAFKAILTAEEHEIRERFKYKGQSIFDPHYDIEKLVEMRASEGALKEREDHREMVA